MIKKTNKKVKNFYNSTTDKLKSGEYKRLVLTSDTDTIEHIKTQLDAVPGLSRPKALQKMCEVYIEHLDKDAQQ